jgi:hypothetical protein
VTPQDSAESCAGLRGARELRYRWVIGQPLTAPSNSVIPSNLEPDSLWRDRWGCALEDESNGSYRVRMGATTVKVSVGYVDFVAPAEE